MAGAHKDQDSQTALKPRIFSCPNCGSPLEISALGLTNSVVCSKCSSIIDIGHPIYKVIGKANSIGKGHQLQKPFPKIPLGSFGVIRNQKWKVIGFMVRRDVKYSVEWREYLLYNPFLGFQFLFEMEDHYTLIKRMTWDPIGVERKSLPDVSEFELKPYGQFTIFNRGDAMVIFVAGEFYWKVKTGSKVYMEDYIRPPYIFSMEQSQGEINFSFGEYISASEIQHAFAQVKDFEYSPPWTIAQNQVNPYAKNYKTNLTWWAFSLAALFAIFILSSVTNVKQRIQNFELSNAQLQENQNNYVSSSFDIKDSYGNVEAEIIAPVRNQWLEAEIRLVNENTGEDYSTESGVEYYFGSDGEGPWSEGNQSNSELISSVPSGKYHVEITTQSDMPEKSLRLILQRHGDMWANFFICLLIISIYPIWMIWRHRAFEISRWEKSDYSPYYSEDDSENPIHDLLNGD